MTSDLLKIWGLPGCRHVGKGPLVSGILGTTGNILTATSNMFDHRQRHQDAVAVVLAYLLPNTSPVTLSLLPSFSLDMETKTDLSQVGMLVQADCDIPNHSTRPNHTAVLGKQDSRVK